MTRGIEVDPLASRATLAPLLADLEARYARLSSELGRARESQLREVLRAFAGQEIDRLLRLAARRVPPDFACRTWKLAVARTLVADAPR